MPITMANTSNTMVKGTTVMMTRFKVSMPSVSVSEVVGMGTAKATEETVSVLRRMFTAVSSRISTY